MNNEVKVLVVGESGSGKTSFIHALLGTPLKSPPCTIGCVVEPLLHAVDAGTPNERACFVELWDVGGSQCHCNSRRVFYNNYDGIILVHDLTNKRTSQNLGQWLAEILDESSSGPGSNYGKKIAQNSVGFDKEKFFAQQKPVLVVGTKWDLLNSVSCGFNNNNPPQTSGLMVSGTPSSNNCARSRLAADLGAEEILVNCLTPVRTSMNNRLKVEKFFDKVFSPFYGRTLGTVNPIRLTSLYERKRW